ncbi:MAG: hypothetical protein ACRC7N_17680 [Clostridium sp.]
MWLFNVKTKPHGIERGEEFLRDSFICIGWPGIGDLSHSSRDEIKESLRNEYNVKGQKLGNYVASVNSFVNLMKEDDIVVISLGEVVHFGRVSGYVYEKSYDNNNEGMCHRRNVKWIGEKNKDEVSVDIKNLLSSRNTVSKGKREFDLDELKVNELDRVMGECEMVENNSTENMFEVKGDLSLDSLMNKALQSLNNDLNSDDIEIRTRTAMEILRIKNK